MKGLLLSVVLQLLVFTAPGFLFYIIKYRTVKGFLDWIGLKGKPVKITNKSAILNIILFGLFVLLCSLITFLNLELKSQYATKFDGLTPGFAMIAIFFTAFINNGLSEEIFFRGFIAKRLINLLGYRVGNIVQSIIFAAVHVVVIMVYGPFFGGINVLLIFGLAYLLGRFVHKNNRGSILLSVLAHAMVNFTAYTIDYFIF